MAKEEDSLSRLPRWLFAAPLWSSATICLLPVCSACLLPTHLLSSLLKAQQRSFITSALVFVLRLGPNTQYKAEQTRTWTWALKLIADILHIIPLLTHQSAEYLPRHLRLAGCGLLMWDEYLWFRSAAFLSVYIYESWWVFQVLASCCYVNKPVYRLPDNSYCTEHSYPSYIWPFPFSVQQHLRKTWNLFMTAGLDPKMCP